MKNKKNNQIKILIDWITMFSQLLIVIEFTFENVFLFKNILK